MTEEVQTVPGDSPIEITRLIISIAKALVDDPASVAVEAISDNDSTILRLQVAQSDVGKIIGKQGRTARSLRTILSAASMKLNHRFSLDIIDNSMASRQ
ncbi:MAG TPA: KH domain-containing protein [Granulicella sp.]